MKRCPFCSEQIQDEAVKCRYCGEFLQNESSGRVTLRSTSSRSSPLQTGGLLLCVLGLGAAFYFFAVFDTSVAVPITEVLGQTAGGGRVNNLGLMSQRQNGVIISCVVAVIGVIAYVAGRAGVASGNLSPDSVLQRYGRKPWLAGLLSLFMPGVGQVYNGQARKGVVFYCLYGIAALVCVVILLALSSAPWNIVFPLGVLLAGYLYILVDAVNTARRQRETFQPKFYNQWYVYLAIIVLLAFVLQPTVSLTIRKVWVQAFKIPSESMKTTLLVGDHILVNKFLYYFTLPQRFDILVFQYPWEDDRDFIKRVIGLPGDRVHVRDRQVYVNDQLLHEPYARYSVNARQDSFGPVVVPKQG